MKYPKKILISLLLLIFTFMWAGCRQEEEKKYTSRIYALDTVIEITVYGEKAEDAAASAEKEIRRLEGLFSVTKESSEIYKLNHSDGSPITLSEDTVALLTEAKKMSSITGGRFDVTIYPVMKLWGFTEKDYKVPDKAQIKAALSSVSTDNILLSENYKVQLKNHAQIDPGGIAKGYIADKVAQAIKNAGADYGIIALGGNIRTVGTKPSGEKWMVGIRDPYSPDLFATLSTDECSVITSGAYQRNFTADGKTYHHIINPKTGYPSDSDAVSVTIIGSEGGLCDALSTAVFIGGSDYAVELQSSGVDFDFVILTKDNNIIASKNLQGSLTLSENFSHLNVIYK